MILKSNTFSPFLNINMLILKGTSYDTGKSFNIERTNFLWIILYFAAEKEQTLKTYNVSKWIVHVDSVCGTCTDFTQVVNALWK